MDKARNRTDKILTQMERRINEVYTRSPALLRIQKKYNKYMQEVSVATYEAYMAYQNEPMGDNRDRLKKAYMSEVRGYTLDNKRYLSIVSEFTEIMADVNQQALDIVNAEMPEIYMLNYNQIADACKKVGIKVNG
jgi:hypothetical protein